MRINNKKLKNRKKLLLDFVSNKEYQPMRAKDIAMLLQIPKGKRSEQLWKNQLYRRCRYQRFL